MDKKDPPKIKDYESDNSSVGSDESLENIGGPNFADFAKRLTYDNTDQYGNNTYFFPFEAKAKEVKKPEYDYMFPSTITTKQEPPKTTDVTTLFLIDSINRDKKAFPQPTTFTLRLPRVYKNVKSVSMTQVKLLCSFYYFSTAKSNIYLPIIEKGRESIAKFNGKPLTKVITIRQGTYGINDLLNEIQTQLNYTPLFYDFPNGFTDFIKLFTVNGDFSINFNQPGDSYYDALNSKYIQNPTLATIISYYWGNRYAGLLSYTIDQLKVAYYYPVLYEVFLDKNDTVVKPKLNLNVPATLLRTNETVYSHLIFNMSGIDDKVALYLINQNITILDTYRSNKTFRYSLVNRYQVAYDSQSLNVYITTSALNTSLVNLINNTGASALTSILNNYNLTTAAFATLQANINKATVVYMDMFQFLQTTLANLAGVSYATYGPQFFNNLDNVLYIQNGQQAFGVRTGYTLDFLLSGQLPITSTITNVSDSPGYWPNLTLTNGYTGTNFSTINSSNSIIPYNVTGKNFLFGTKAIDSSNYYFNTNKSTRSVDVVVDVEPAKYNIFKFRSPVRQTLQVETLPLPYYYRYSDYNKNGLYKGVLDLSKNNVPQEFFDISYNFLYTSTNRGMDVTNYSALANVLYPSFGTDFHTALSTVSTFRASSQANYGYFEFISPYPPPYATGLYAYNTKLSFVSMANVSANPNTSTLFPDKFSMFVYHDRGAFMADIGKIRSENPVHYIQSVSTNTTKSDMTVSFSTFSGHKYYTIFRSDNLSCSNTSYKPVVYYDDSNYVYIDINNATTNFDPNGNPFDPSNLTNYLYLTNYNTDFTRLPVQSTIQGPDPSSSTFNILLPTKGPSIGYDISGVSNDLTDYIGFNDGKPGIDPSTEIRIDPLNYYTFSALSPYDNVNQTYFNINSQNSILTPFTGDLYNFQGVSTSQLKIVHWYNGYCIPKQLDDRITTTKTIRIASAASLSRYITSYPVDASNNIQFGRGINAIGFLPTDGVYTVSSFAFRSCVYPISSLQATSEDPNLQIKYIGVFSGVSLVNTTIALSSAITVLKYDKSIVYSPNTLKNTPGFGVELGTWYNYTIDPNFVPLNPISISGYTASGNELISYDSMYYMVPFNSNGVNLTYSYLSGSILPYPLGQNISVVSSFYGQVTQNPPGTAPQTEYTMPRFKSNANPAYGPQSYYSQTQSQYEQSIPITTPSIGYKNNPVLVTDLNAPFPFTTTYSNSQSQISSIGLTTFFTEYSNTLYTVNSSSINCSNARMSFPSAYYASSLSTAIKSYSGTTDSIKYLISLPSTLQNYPIMGTVLGFSTFTYQQQAGDNANITIQSIEFLPTMSNVTLWMWGAGGGTWQNTSSISGGAGAYAKVNINVKTLLNTITPDAPGGISTLYMVVGKGGNADNFTVPQRVGSLQQYEQARYGGGGTSLLGKYTDSNSISLQGGGFSGLFSGSNLLNATPLLIVGGGGAAGANDLGGPGGFGFTPAPSTIQQYTFNNVTFQGITYNKTRPTGVTDVFNNAIYNGSNVSNILDLDISTYWGPLIPSVMNPTNYYSTPDTYGVSVLFPSTISSIQKIKYWGPPEFSTLNVPTGIVIYNDINKTQVLYSNTSIQSIDFDIINNGSFQQHVYEMIPTAQVQPTTISSNAWIAGGSNVTSQSAIQYSLDGITWIPTANSLLSNVTSIQYVPLFNKWYAAGSTIVSSTDGIKWIACTVRGTNPPTAFNTIAFNQTIMVAGTNNGSFYNSTDGIIWNISGTGFSANVSRIRFVNGLFWAFGGTTAAVKKSSDGRIWTNVNGIGTSGINDITYSSTISRYVIVQSTGTAPFFSSILYSTDGIIWFPSGQLNISTFIGLSVVFANGLFVAVGRTTDNSSYIKYSTDGINWSNSRLVPSGNSQINTIEYSGNVFISLSKPLAGNATNQVSILTSTDGIRWSYSLSGAFSHPGSANSVSYGPVTILPNLSTLYIEFQKTTNTSNRLHVHEISFYDSISNINGDPSSIIQPSIPSIFYPAESQTVEVYNYPFTFKFPSVVPKLNTIQIYTPDIPTAQFTGLTISLSTSVVYADLNVSSIKSFSTNMNSYMVSFIPSLSNVSTLNFNFIKDTLSSLQLSYVVGNYNPNVESKEIPGFIAIDTDSRPATGNISNIIDNSLSTSWKPNVFTPGDTLKVNFTFATAMSTINHVQIFNGTYPPVLSNLVTGVGVYTDSSKSVQLYSNTNLLFKPYQGYSMIEFGIVPLLGYNSVYVELGKLTFGSPLINGIKFYGIGSITDTSSGYSGGNPVSMTRYTNPYTPYNGGGGSNVGGIPGSYAVSGNYLTGGSPASLYSHIQLSTTTSITLGSGGGGGGYYGGGGGGAITNNTGGSGGGGSGFMFSTIFTLLDYGVASPGSNTLIKNFVTPGFSQQSTLAYSNIFIPPSIPYGQGGTPEVNSGKGAHGFIALTYEITKMVQVNITEPVFPSFIDGSKLSLYEAPIIENTNVRKIQFNTYKDSIQLSQYSSKNWVWYNSYLSMVGGSLTHSMQPSITQPAQPLTQWPYLPVSTFNYLSSQFNSVNSLFTLSTIIQPALVNSITSTITGAFTHFQNTYLIKTRHTDPSYYQMTEAYCLLDYLKESSNLTNPHVNPINSRLDRVFGGIPRFGYWANPFLVNTSYIGFDVTNSQIPLSTLSTIAQNGNTVQAMYGLVLEQSLTTGVYEFKDIMAYKPTQQDATLNGLNWLTATQFPEAYVVRSLTNPINMSSNVPVQPYTFKNAIAARLPLFNYNVYTIPSLINNTTYDIPVQTLNDFEGQSIYMYCFQNTNLADISSIHITTIPLTSTTIKLNQINITEQLYNRPAIIGTLVSEYQSTIVNAITSLSFNGQIYEPLLKYSSGTNNYYNTYDPNSPIINPYVGKALNDYLGNFYVSDKNTNVMYENICSIKIYQQPFNTSNVNFASPGHILSQYKQNITNPYSDFFLSKYTNIWHLPTNSFSTMDGVRLNSPYDYKVVTSFVNQIFYPAHKIVLNKTQSFLNPIKNTIDVLTYPSYQHTEMFFYKNFSSLVNDISGQFANEKMINFAYKDAFSGYGFDSYIYNINLTASTDFNNDNVDSFNYLAVRAYSPTERFQSLVRFYLPQRYDFGYISLKDLSNEQLVVSTATLVNPEYKQFLTIFNDVFNTTQIYGETGVAGFSGSNISTVSFGDFLTKFNAINAINSSNTAILSSINGLSNAAISGLINGDLQNILPSYLATRNRTTDPIEYSIPFSTCVTPSNAIIEQYGLGYNLGFPLADTSFNTIQTASSFFKILDDSIFLRLNEEFGMNKMDMSQPENFSQTLDTTAQSGRYNSKLILNSFGSFATTFVQSPVSFNPPIGKLDKLSFTWYDYTGAVLNNADCEWSGSVQIVEAVTASA
jgi:hypothetical protein